MSDLKVTITRWGEVVFDKRELSAVMRGAANMVRSSTARLINSTSGAGRVYPGGGGSAYRGAYRPGPYRASAPGDPPVKVSNTLRGSLKAYVYKSGEGFAVRERAFYSLFLEAGAKGGGNPGKKGTRFRNGKRVRAKGAFTTRVLEPRPHLDRVMKAERPEIDRRAALALRQGLKWKETK